MKPQCKPTLTVGLLWHSFSSDNLGVGALSESQLAICDAAAELAGVDIRYVVFGTTGARNYASKGKALSFGGWISIKDLLAGRSRFMAELDQCDLVLDIGEGDSFTDIYGLRRFRYHIISKLVALHSGKPLILSPQTIGPFQHWYTRGLAAWVMRRCEKVYCRDRLSADYVHALGHIEGVEQAIDVAFRLPYSRPDNHTSNRCRIGLNVSGLLYSGGYDGQNQFGLALDYPKLVRDLIAHWQLEPANEVWLIPHVLSDQMPRDDDRIAIAQLAEEFPQVRVGPQFNSPSEAKSFIAGMDFVTGARMHACIAAFSSGVPVVPLAYSRKFNGLFESLGYCWLADGKAMSNAEALSAVIDGFERRTELAAAIPPAMTEAEQRLGRYENYLAGIFRRCAEIRVVAPSAARTSGEGAKHAI